METPTRYTCPICMKNFSKKSNLKRHEKVHQKGVKEKQQYKCEICGKSFLYESYLKRHMKTHDKNLKKKFICSKCSGTFSDVETLKEHIAEAHPGDAQAYGIVEQRNKVEHTPVTEEEALDGSLKIVTFIATGDQKYSLNSFHADTQTSLMKYIKNFHPEGSPHIGVKWHTICEVKFAKFEEAGNEENTVTEKIYTTAYLHCKMKRYLTSHDDTMLTMAIQESQFEINENFDNFTDMSGTGWTIDEVISMKLNMAEYQPIAGSSYFPLPPNMGNRKGIVNIQNFTDNKCFLWSLLAALHPQEKNPQRVNKYKKYTNEICMKGIDFPVKIGDIPKVERMNKNLSINVYGCELTDKVNGFYPLYISPQLKCNHVNLLLVSNHTTNHYCLIKDLNKMLYHLTKHKGKKYFCTHCLHGFTAQVLLQNHIEGCYKHDPTSVKLPEGRQSFMEFKDWKKTMKVPYVIYADFECILEPIPSSVPGETNLKRNKHTPCGYSYLVCSSVEGDSPGEAITYSGPDVIEHFFQSIMIEVDNILEKFKNKKPMKFTDIDKKHYNNTTVCHICEGIIFDPNDKVRDHCHLTGKYRGPAHSKCNLSYQISKKVPIFFHNLEGYDSHILMQELGKFKNQKIGCIAKNMERYISFNLGNIVFLDSYHFMSASLGQLVDNLAAEGDTHFTNVKHHYPNHNHRKLLLRKGVYPYEWMDSMEKMDNENLPPKEAFYSTLTMLHISDEDYCHAQKVWETFHMTCMRDYHDLYLKTDVLLLADCFQNFRQKCMEFYQLDPPHFCTTPGLSWTAALKKTGVTLDLLTDMDMHLMIEAGVRGGVSTIITRYAKANNKYMGDDYDPSSPSVYLMDFDANNLYGWAMSQPLPTHSFQWVTDQYELSRLFNDIKSIPSDSSTGYILEVDLYIPPHLHDYLNDYVPAPDHIEVTNEMLSQYSIDAMIKMNLHRGKSIKLTPNLYNKTKYVLHYRALQCYLDKGLELVKIHRVIQFHQSPWLKEYIDFNTNQRKKAKNNFERNFFKLMNNSVFGKTIENLRKRSNVKLVHSREEFKKLILKPTVQSFQRFNENLAAVKMKKIQLTLNRPIYAGFTILDLAKVLMTDFYYNVLKKKYDMYMNLLFTDTDSLALQIYTDDIYEDMVEMEDEFDLSDYPKNHPLYNPKNKKVLGKFKDERNGQIITEYVGLRSKMYSMVWKEGDARTCKGISKHVNREYLKHDKYKQALFQDQQRVDKVVRIGTENHQLYTYETQKVSLSPFDDKRYVIEDKITTLAFGHYSLLERQ